MNEQLAINSNECYGLKNNTPCSNFYSVEFSVKGIKLLYQSKLWSSSPETMFVLVKENSDILNWIQAGDILDMKYYSEDEVCPIKTFNTKIQYITRDENGRFKGHYLIGLTILSDQIDHCQVHHASFS